MNTKWNRERRKRELESGVEDRRRDWVEVGGGRAS
jgi:hypothetical protein